MGAHRRRRVAMNTDKITLGINRAMDLLFLKHPTKTSLGILLGLVVHGGISLFTPYLKQFSFISISNIRLWHVIPFGVCLIYIREIVTNLISPPAGNESVDDLLRIIRLGNFSAAEKRRKYRELSEKFMEKAFSDNVVKDKIKQTEKA